MRRCLCTRSLKFFYIPNLSRLSFRRMNGTTTNQYQTQRVERGLNDPYHDIYLARFLFLV